VTREPPGVAYGATAPRCRRGNGGRARRTARARRRGGRWAHGLGIVDGRLEVVEVWPAAAKLPRGQSKKGRRSLTFFWWWVFEAKEQETYGSKRIRRVGWL
jgi:hypothetical protein